MSKVELDYSKIVDVDVADINESDYPDFSDAYIDSATIENEDGTFREATDDELEYLSDDRDFVYQQIEKRIY